MALRWTARRGGGGSAREQELRWARPSHTQAARRRGGLSPRAAGLETGNSWQITIPRRPEQSSHSSLTSLKIGGFAGHILGHDAPPFSYGLLGPLLALTVSGCTSCGWIWQDWLDSPQKSCRDRVPEQK